MTSGHYVKGYDLSWHIIRASLSFLKSDELIYSSDFKTNYLSTEWVLFLRSSLSDGHLNIYLQRNIDKGPESIRVLLKDVKLKRWSILKLKNPLEFIFEKGDAFCVLTFPYFHEELVKAISNPSTDKAYFYCRLCLASDIFHADVLDELSSDMRFLYLKPVFYDTTLRFNKVKVNFHQAIFEARTNSLRLHDKQKLFRVKKFQTSGRNKKGPSICDLFQFLYSAQIDCDSNFRKSNIAEVARRLGLRDFVNKCFSEVTGWYNLTTLKCKRRFLSLSIDIFKLEHFHSTIFDIGETKWRLKLKHSITDSEESTSIDVSPTKVVPDIDYDIRVVVVMQGFCKKDLSSKIAYGSIKSSNPGKKKLKIDLKYQRNKGTSMTPVSFVRFLFFSIEIWDGKINSAPKTKKTRMTSKPANVFTLSSDLLQLFETKSLADVKVLVPDGKFRVHKAILCARSPVFSRMFKTNMKEKNNGVVTITDLGKSVMAKLLKYVYSGQLYFEDIEETIQLAYAADKYLMVSLRDKCLKHLRNQYDKNFVLDIYVAFDFLRCDELKAGYEEYIRYIFKRCPRNSLDDFEKKFPTLFRKLFVK